MTTARELQARADELGDELAGLSAKASTTATRRLRVQLAELRRDLVRAWIQRYGSVAAIPAELSTAAPFTALAVARVTAALDMRLVDHTPVEAAWLAAYAAGNNNSRDVVADPLIPAMNLERSVARAGIRAVAGLSSAAVLAQGFTAVTVALTRADSAVTGIEAAVSFELTRAASQAVTDAARTRAVGRIWVAERNGCVHCLAYAGQTTLVEVFPTGLTFGDKPLNPPGALIGPPLHPRCRCILQLWTPADQPAADALQREAKRSVLRGWSLESESEASRLRAAERLLARGSGLPTSVEQYAGRSVRRGEFPRGRDVPA